MPVNNNARHWLGCARLAAYLYLACSAAWAAPSAPVIVNSAAPEDSAKDTQPCVAGGPNGTWVAAWSILGPSGTSDIYFARSTDGGQHWTTQTLLHDTYFGTSGTDVRPAIATDGQGNWTVAWASKFTGANISILYSESSNDGQAWSSPLPRATRTIYEDENFYAPKVFSVAPGNWMVSWNYWRSGTGSSGDFGSGCNYIWAHGVEKSTGITPGFRFSTPQLATNGQGVWLACWHKEIASPYADPDHELFKSVSNDNGQTWSANSALDPSFDGTGQARDRNFALATDRQGLWMAAWSVRSGSWSVLGATSTNNGTSWSTPLQLSASTAGNPVIDPAPQLIHDGRGNWILAWSTDRLGGDRDLMMMTRGAGEANWSAPQALNPWASTDTGATTDECLNLASDGQGGWTAVWSSNWDPELQGNGDYEIYSINVLPPSAADPAWMNIR